MDWVEFLTKEKAAEHPWEVEYQTPKHRGTYNMACGKSQESGIWGRKIQDSRTATVA